MSPKPLLATLATSAILAGALLLPTGVVAHERHHSDHSGHHHSRSHHTSRKHKHKHVRRVVHEHHYAPVYSTARPYYREGGHRRGYGNRNQITITYSRGW